VDHIRRLGPVDRGELRRRTAQPELLDRWLEELSEAGRIFVLAGRQEWVVVEDAATVRDGLGAELPNGLPADLLIPAPHALRDLTLRYARTHGPFRAGELAAHYDLPVAALRSEEHTSELQPRFECGCRLLLLKHHRHV